MPLSPGCSRSVLRGTYITTLHARPFLLPSTRNPIPRSAYESFKFWFIVLSGILFLRVIVFITMLLLGGFFGCLAAIGAPKDLSIPYPWWRRALAAPISPLARILLFSLGFHWISVDDRQKTKGQVIVIAPHTGLMDSFFITWYFLPSPISKSAVRNIPVFGSLCIALQSIFVDRENAKDGPYSRSKVLQTINARARDTRFPRMCIFPEGTCGNGSVIMNFKKGAFVPGEAVTPLLLQYHANHYTSCGKQHHYNPACCGANSSDASLIRCFFQFHNTMSAVILDARSPTDKEKADPDLFATNVRAEMAAQLNLPTTEHSYADIFLGEVAAKCHGSHEKYPDFDFTCDDLQKKWGVDGPMQKVLVSRFVELNGSAKGGGVTAADLHASLGDKPAGKDRPLVDRLHAFFQTTTTGRADERGAPFLSLKEFLQAIACTRSQATIEEKAALAMCVYAGEGGDSVSHVELVLGVDKAGKGAAIVDPIKVAVEESMFQRFDANKDGRLDREEFKKLAEAYPAVLGPALEFTKRLLGISFEDAKITASQPSENHI